MRHTLLLVLALLAAAQPLASQGNTPHYQQVAASSKWQRISWLQADRRLQAQRLEAAPRYAALCPKGTSAKINDTTTVSIPGDNFWDIAGQFAGRYAFWDRLILDNLHIRVERLGEKGREKAVMQPCQVVNLGRLLRSAGIELPRPAFMELLPDTHRFEVGKTVELALLIYNQWGGHMTVPYTSWSVTPAKRASITPRGMLIMKRRGDAVIKAITANPDFWGEWLVEGYNPPAPWRKAYGPWILLGVLLIAFAFAWRQVNRQPARPVTPKYWLTMVFPVPESGVVTLIKPGHPRAHLVSAGRWYGQLNDGRFVVLDAVGLTLVNIDTLEFASASVNETILSPSDMARLRGRAINIGQDAEDPSQIDPPTNVAERIAQELAAPAAEPVPAGVIEHPTVRRIRRDIAGL